MLRVGSRAIAMSYQCSDDRSTTIRDGRPEAMLNPILRQWHSFQEQKDSHCLDLRLHHKYLSEWQVVCMFKVISNEIISGRSCSLVLAVRVTGQELLS